MQSPSDADLRQTLYKAALLLLAIAINALEFFAPRIPFLPWLKPGLANIVTIIWILRFGTADALVYTVIRSWVVGFYFGFSLVTLLLSLSGGLCSTLLMGLAWQLLGRRRLLGLAGLGIVGALAHNAAQLLVVYLLLARNAAIFYQAPAMAAASVLFGAVTGLLAAASWRSLDIEAVKTAPLANGPGFPAVQPRFVLLSGLLLCVAMVPAFLTDLRTLAAAAVTATLLVQAAQRGSLTALFHPLRRFWLLFAFVACVHLFMSYGRALAWLPWATEEGLREALVQSLRLWTWLQLSLLLPHVRFHDVFFGALARALPGSRATLLAGLLSLEYFPDALDRARRRALSAFVALVRSPADAAGTVVGGLYLELVEQLVAGRRGPTRG